MTLPDTDGVTEEPAALPRREHRSHFIRTERDAAGQSVAPRTRPHGRITGMVSQYVATALERAQYQLLEDGSFAATVRGLRGVIATGTTLEACRRALAEVVEEWILIRVSRGLAVPALGKAVVRVHRAS